MQVMYRPQLIAARFNHLHSFDSVERPKSSSFGTSEIEVAAVRRDRRAQALRSELVGHRQQ